MRSLKSRIIWQFAAIVAPLALVLFYQTTLGFWRTEKIAEAVRNVEVLEKINKQYKLFVDGIVDSVEIGKLSSGAFGA
ncbi:MAG: hypothetical protein ACKVQK_04790, partial [Burkholderiales bacterium]